MDRGATHGGKNRPGLLARRRFILTATSCATAGLIGTSTATTHDGDAALEQLRRGNFGATPFARIGITNPMGMFIGLTDDAVRLLQSGTPATHAGQMHAADGYHADLYSLEIREQPRSFLIVRRGRHLTDIAAGFRTAPPVQSSENLTPSASSTAWSTPEAGGRQ